MRSLLVLCSALTLVPMARAEDVDFAAKIQPILEKSCYSCHGDKKKKGGIRLHTKDEIAQAEVIVPGKPEESELLRRIALPADDEDVMPPEGGPLSAEDIELVRQWIAQGAKIAGETVAPKPEAPEKTVAEAPAEAIAALEELGALVIPLSQKTNFLNVDFRSRAGEIGDEEIKMLAGVAEQVAWLNLARTKVSDAGLATLANLKNLSRLHLELTGVGDAGLAHLAALPDLEYLNVYSTQVTDAGLQHLAGLGKLTKLFVWQSQVTYEGAQKLKETLTALDVNLGWDNPGVRLERAKRNIELAKQAQDEATKAEEAARLEKEAAAAREEAAKKDKEAAAARLAEAEKEIAELSGEKKEEAPPAEGEKKDA